MGDGLGGYLAETATGARMRGRSAALTMPRPDGLTQP
jgi:hypothetical protein